MRPLHLATLLAATTMLCSAAQARNEGYGLRLLADHSVEVSHDGAKRRLEPVFTLIVAEADPRYRFSSSLNNVSFAEGYALPMWNKPGSTDKTDVMFDAGRTATMRAAAAREEGGRRDREEGEADGFTHRRIPGARTKPRAHRPP